MISSSILLLAVIPALALVDPTQEVEPNQTRETATPATIANNGAFSGTSRGFQDDPTSTDSNTRDMWRITLTANPAVIQRHMLQLTTAGTQGHTGSILGTSAISGVIDPATSPALQNTSINTVPGRTCVVYTLGQPAPWFYYRLTGSSGTTSPYVVTLTSTTITPTPIRPCPFIPGEIKITTVGRTNANTKLFLYDAMTLAPIEGGINDDTPPSAGNSTGSSQSTLVRTLGPGKYILAISNTDAVDNRLPPADDRYTTLGFANLTESPGLIVNGSSSAAGDFSFSILDRTMYDTSTPPLPLPLNINAAKPGSYGVVFYSFELCDKCGSADMGRTGGQACQDNRLDNNDFIVFIDLFFRAQPAADVGTAGGLPGRDTRFDNNDWIAYLNLFFGGCP
ncbi:MAG: GC-type dockerin domain-anchored protein [Phycisphaerales bacterium]